MAACLSNLKQISLAVLQYAQDYDETLPTAGYNAGQRGRWFHQIGPYVKNYQVFTCPNLPDSKLTGKFDDNKSGYGWAGHLDGMNANTAGESGYSLAAIAKPAETITVGDTGYNNCNGWIMFRIPPKEIQANPAVTNPVVVPMFRHHATNRMTVAVQNCGTTSASYPLDGLATFAFLDGHAKALKPGAAFVEAATEDGANLNDTTRPGNVDGRDKYLLWNRY